MSTVDDASRVAPTAPAAGRLSALGSPGYRRYWLGSLASVGGAWLMYVGQGWLVFELTGSPWDLGLLGAAISIPNIAMNLLGGVLADRVDRRRLLAATSAIAAVLLVALAALDLSERVALWHVLAIAVAIGLVTGIEWPTRQAIFVALVPREQLGSAVMLNSILWQVTRLVFPGIAGVMIAVAGTGSVFVTAAMGFAVMALVAMTLPVEGAGTGGAPSRGGMIEGLRFIFTTPVFATLIGLAWAVTFFGMSYIQIMPTFTDLLGVGERGYGALMSVSGLGSVLGTLLVGSAGGGRRPGAILVLGALGGCVALWAFAAVAAHPGEGLVGFALALGCAVLASGCMSIYIVLSMTVLQLRVPEVLRGRVMGIYAIAFSLISLGGVFSGALAEFVGPPLAVAAGAGVIALITVAVALGRRELGELAPKA